jgi:hypothetical protein
VLFKAYCNRERTHDSLGGVTPAAKGGSIVRRPLDLAAYQWQSHCRGLCNVIVDVGKLLESERHSSCGDSCGCVVEEL